MTTVIFFVFNAVCSLFIHIHVVLKELYFNNYLWERENYKQFCNQIFKALLQRKFRIFFSGFSFGNFLFGP